MTCVQSVIVPHKKKNRYIARHICSSNLFFGGAEGSISQALPLEECRNSPCGLFLCRFLPRVARCSLPFLVRLPIKRKTDISQDISVHLTCFLVEPRGVEPLSKNLFTQLSPGAVGGLTFPYRYARLQAYQLSSLLSWQSRGPHLRTFTANRRPCPAAVLRGWTAA